MESATATILRTSGEMAPVNYLNRAYGVRSWLLTTDHKRIGILYLWTIILFFTIASVAAAMMRIELLTPQGGPGHVRDLQQARHDSWGPDGLVLSHSIDPERAG